MSQPTHAEPHDRPEVVAAESDPPPEYSGGLPARWQRNLFLFLATVASVLVTPWFHNAPAGEPFTFMNVLRAGWDFALPLMAILLTHELGHYFAARYHRVPASLPFFIPLPVISLFGTMGAVISMPKRIKSRDALLDIGAAGPIAGMVVAIPVLLIGLSESEVRKSVGGGLMEGQCLLYSLLKHVAVGPIPEGHDVFLNNVAFAGWTGLLITMLNMLPILQLDGGHIAYALFQRHFSKLSRFLHYALLGVFAYNYFTFRHADPGIVWLVWFALLTGLRRMSGGVEHPPTDPGTLSPRRRWVAMACLVMFVLIFMPTPLRELPLQINARLSEVLASFS
jgi:membrane-associated protease RseP (regulator of RpoE activity)